MSSSVRTVRESWGSRRESGRCSGLIQKHPALTSARPVPSQNMCTIEVELESLLGEFCIKMKGILVALLPLWSLRRHLQPSHL